MYAKIKTFNNRHMGICSMLNKENTTQVEVYINQMKVDL